MQGWVQSELVSLEDSSMLPEWRAYDVSRQETSPQEQVWAAVTMYLIPGDA